MIDALASLPNDPPSIYIEIEGTKLAQHGSISIVQVHDRTTGHTYLVDIKTLGSQGFTTPGRHTNLIDSRVVLTLQTLLESPAVDKVFFDVRPASEALYALYGIGVRGVREVQLMEVAARPRGTTTTRTAVLSLHECAERDLLEKMAPAEDWREVEAAACCLFMPERGGRREVFDRRPLSTRLRRYWVQNMKALPKLFDVYNAKLSGEWRRRICVDTIQRVADTTYARGYRV